jgi:hypothetical protein
MFPFPCILQHNVEFDTCTITTLKKLLGAGSFGDSIDHLACHQAIILASLNRLNLLYVVQIATFAFLGCWALIILHFHSFPIR